MPRFFLFPKLLWPPLSSFHGLLCCTIRIQNLFSLLQKTEFEYLATGTFSCLLTWHFLPGCVTSLFSSSSFSSSFFLSFFYVLLSYVLSLPPFLLPLPPSLPSFLLSHPILSLWIEFFTEDLFNHLCCIGSWLYVPHDLSWTGPLKNMSSWESFLCGWLTSLLFLFTGILHYYVALECM